MRGAGPAGRIAVLPSVSPAFGVRAQARSPRMTTLATSLRQDLARLLEPLVTAAGSADRWALLLSLVGEPEAARNPAVKAALDQLATLADLDDLDLDSWDGLQAILAKGRQSFTAVRQLSQVTGAPADLGEALAEQLTAIYLRRYRARIFRAAALLTFGRGG